ncbi:MAG: ribokinase [Oscillospiraceae bacterium]|nr:ribokinase [Oscillospiraceae bacterium]
MKILNFGSLNIDIVYAVEHIVKPGETISAPTRALHAGGKGLNQSVAAARAGAQVIHAGNIGADGAFLAELLRDAGADVSHLRTLDVPSGHAVIQVDKNGQNSILVCGGANRMYDREYIDAMLSLAEPGDFVLTQNETNEVPYLLRSAHAKGLRVALNPSPMTEDIPAWPLECVSLFLVNETEGEAITGKNTQEDILAAMEERFPNAETILTLGKKGAVRSLKGQRIFQKSYPVKAVDTTAAGDTFTGFYLAGLIRGETPETALNKASMASAIAVSRPGAAPSIPLRKEVEDAL